MGENGAGKSTLIKILSGVYQKDGGSVLIDGVPVEVHNTLDSQKLGISVIYQEFALVPELSIAQNAFLGKEKCKAKFFFVRPRDDERDRKIHAEAESQGERCAEDAHALR